MYISRRKHFWKIILLYFILYEDVVCMIELIGKIKNLNYTKSYIY